MAAYAQSVGKPADVIISLVLTDIEMPEMDGYILTKQIKSDPPFRWVAGRDALVPVGYVESATGHVGRGG